MPVLAAAFCPHPPLLAPELAGGAAPELDGLRAQCDEAVGAIAAYGVPVLVLGPGTASTAYGPQASGTLAPWGVDVRAGGTDAATLPLSLTLGAWLLDRSGVPLEVRRYRSVADAETAGTADEVARLVADECVLLVMADGSSTRTAKAPGGPNPASEGYDAAVATALAAGQPADLAAASDAASSRAVGAGGAATWRTVAEVLEGAPPSAGRLLTAEAPYGVCYLVATWTWPQHPPAP